MTMFQQADIAFRQLQCLVADLTREISANKEQAAATAAQVAALQIQVSELFDKVKEIKDKQEQQERENEHDDGLPSDFEEELAERRCKWGDWGLLPDAWRLHFKLLH